MQFKCDLVLDERDCASVLTESMFQPYNDQIECPTELHHLNDMADDRVLVCVCDFRANDRDSVKSSVWIWFRCSRRSIEWFRYAFYQYIYTIQSTIMMYSCFAYNGIIFASFPSTISGRNKGDHTVTKFVFLFLCSLLANTHTHTFSTVRPVFIVCNKVWSVAHSSHVLLGINKSRLTMLHFKTLAAAEIGRIHKQKLVFVIDEGNKIRNEHVI